MFCKHNMHRRKMNLTLRQILKIMDWYILIPFGIVAIALIVFLIRRNQKDEKGFEEQLKDDYPKPKNEMGDTDVDEVTK